MQTQAASTLEIEEAARRKRASQRAIFDAKVRRIGYVDRVTGRRIHDPEQLGQRATEGSSGDQT